jgi:hypothetical protein
MIALLQRSICGKVRSAVGKVSRSATTEFDIDASRRSERTASRRYRDSARTFAGKYAEFDPARPADIAAETIAASSRFVGWARPETRAFGDRQRAVIAA